jgi:hypothetical protein
MSVVGRRLLILITVGVFTLGLSASSVAHTTGNACPMSHVRYVAYPGVEQGLEKVPWISSAPGGSFKAHLFFYGGVPWAKDHLLGARIFTTTRPRNINPKVLWITRSRGYGLTLRIQGRRLDAPGSFSDKYKGFGDYPSYVNVPVPGCWRVTVTSGRVSGRVVFSATD